uniref:BBE domain-containing protein n=1 Tax=Streptomyces pseudogriseolus TaxID=36817 RepID=UPI003FA0CA8E
NRVAPTATAFVHRRSRVLAQYLASWNPGSGDGSTIRAWLTDTHQALRPHASGTAYQNYTDPGLTDWRRAYYGEAAPRLSRLKRRYDPDRVFTTPQTL